jgi:hypothetical protein
MLIRVLADKSGPEPPLTQASEEAVNKYMNAFGVDRDTAIEHLKAVGMIEREYPWPCAGVEVECGERTSITRRAFDQALQEGWLTVQGNVLEIGGKKFNILRSPGTYCCHCGARITDDQPKAHVARCAQGADSPDPQNPSGYEVIDFYDLELIDSSEVTEGG